MSITAMRSSKILPSFNAVPEQDNRRAAFSRHKYRSSSRVGNILPQLESEEEKIMGIYSLIHQAVSMIDTLEKDYKVLQDQIEALTSQVWRLKREKQPDITAQVKQIVEKEQDYTSVADVIKDLRGLLDKKPKGKTVYGINIVTDEPNKATAKTPSIQLDPETTEVNQDKRPYGGDSNALRKTVSEVIMGALPQPNKNPPKFDNDSSQSSIQSVSFHMKDKNSPPIFMGSLDNLDFKYNEQVIDKGFNIFKADLDQIDITPIVRQHDKNNALYKNNLESFSNALNSNEPKQKDTGKDHIIALPVVANKVENKFKKILIPKSKRLQKQEESSEKTVKNAFGAERSSKQSKFKRFQEDDSSDNNNSPNSKDKNHGPSFNIVASDIRKRHIKRMQSEDGSFFNQKERSDKKSLLNEMSSNSDLENPRKRSPSQDSGKNGKFFGGDLARNMGDKIHKTLHSSDEDGLPKKSNKLNLLKAPPCSQTKEEKPQESIVIKKTKIKRILKAKPK